MIYVIADDHMAIRTLVKTVLTKSGVLEESDEIVTFDNPGDTLEYIKNVKKPFRPICDGFYSGGEEEADGPWIPIFEEYKKNEFGKGFIVFSSFKISQERYEGLDFCLKGSSVEPLVEMIDRSWGTSSKEGRFPHI